MIIVKVKNVKHFNIYFLKKQLNKIHFMYQANIEIWFYDTN